MAKIIEKPPFPPRKYKIGDEYRIKKILTERLFENHSIIAEIVVQFVLEEKIAIKTKDIFQIRRQQFELNLPGIEIYVHTQKIPTSNTLPTTYIISKFTF
jgi:hypothetical protein